MGGRTHIGPSLSDKKLLPPHSGGPVTQRELSQAEGILQMLTDNLEDVQERLHAGDPLVNPEIVFEARHKKDTKQKHVASLRNALAFGQTAPAPAPVSNAGRLRGFSTVPALTVRVDTSNVPSRRIVRVNNASISRRGPRHIHFDDSTNSASRPSTFRV
jgi:hypothetical protein